MAIPAAAIAKAAVAVLTNDKTRKAAGWVLVAILSPVILLIAAFCSILGGSAQHNTNILDLCFYGGTLPADLSAEYRVYIEDIQTSFSLLDERITEINSMTDEGTSLDAIRVKDIFFALYFGADSPSSRVHQEFVDCFVTYEERTRTEDDSEEDETDSTEESDETDADETYTVAVPITDMATIWSNIQTKLGITVTEEQQGNADSIYNLNGWLDPWRGRAVYRGGRVLFSCWLRLGVQSYIRVWLSIRSLYRPDERTHWHRHRCPYRHASPCGSARRGHDRCLQRRRIWLLCDDRSRQRYGDPICPQF